jgi:1A family penicillin-binding protein
MNSYYYSNWNKNNRNAGITGVVWSYLSQFGKWLFKLIKTPKFFLRLFQTLFFLVLIVGAVGVAGFFLMSSQLPDPNRLSNRVVAQSTKIYARDGTTLLYEIHGEAKRTLIELKDIPDNIKNATIAIEDKNFYTNKGFDWKGIIRAVFANLTSGDLTGQGGSTITQQFVKNAILTREKTYTRKIKEVILSVRIEQAYSKDQILQMYLNEISYGQNAYGIEAAAQTYFNKNAKDVTLAEAAYLAALPQRPTYFSPLGPNRDKLDDRKNLVLDLMRDQGYIKPDEAEKAKSEKVSFSKVKTSILAPHFVMYVQGLLAEKYGEKTLQEGGLKIVTTLDYDLQKIAEKAVKDGVERNKKNNKAINASLVAIDPKTGQILAMVGSSDYFDEENDGQVNVAIRERQPGSSIKPYVYAAAFKKGMSPATMIMDVKTVFGTYGDKEYAPENYNGVSYGPLPIRKALAGSLNVPAVKVLSLTGIQEAIDTMKDMGITSNINTERCGLSLVLGGCEITLLDHTAAMGVFANLGIKHQKTPILKITDNEDKVLEEYNESGGIEVLDPQVAYEIVSIMKDNDARSFIFGSNSPLILPNRPVAAKTGTTQLWKDGWTMGYTPSLVAGVWTGNNDSSPMRQGADGVVTAGPIWNQFMREALKDKEPEQFLEAAGIQRIYVDSVSGKIPTEYTPITKEEVFADFAVPKEEDDVHMGIRVNKMNNKIATDSTPTEYIESRVYTIFESERPDNPNWEIPVQVWAKKAGYNNQPTEYDDGGAGIADENTPFQLKFASPATGQEFQLLPIPVQIDATGQKVSNVSLFLEGVLIGEKSTAPFTFLIEDAKNGWQTLRAVATLQSGDVFENSVRIRINTDQ